MTLATYLDLCIDVVDEARMERFYAELLGMTRESDRPGHSWLAGPDGHRVWINQVPEPKTVKNRVHLDVHCASIAEVEALGAVVQRRDEHWTVMADPEGQDFCAFVRADPPAYRLYELVWDCADPIRVADWWASVLGVEAGHEHEDDGDWAYIENVPNAPFDNISFVPVPEPKTVKNRVHIDVETDSVEALVAAGATVLRAQDDEIDWTVMADVEGNEFCAFLRESP